jgi:hypothetical protein
MENTTIIRRCSEILTALIVVFTTIVFIYTNTRHMKISAYDISTFTFHSGKILIKWTDTTNQGVHHFTFHSGKILIESFLLKITGFVILYIPLW